MALATTFGVVKPKIGVPVYSKRERDRGPRTSHLEWETLEANSCKSGWGEVE